MKKILLILMTFQTFVMLSQDFGIYPRYVDDKVNLPFVHESMRIDEFQLLSRNVRMMDMLYAGVVPGYIHFKAKENKKGYVLLGLRSAAYIGLAVSYINSKVKDDKTIDIIGEEDHSDEIVINENWSIKKRDIVVGTSIVVIMTTYLYDWIHGKYMLEKKQEYIRYKYSLKLKLEENKLSYNANKLPLTYGLSLTLNF